MKCDSCSTEVPDFDLTYISGEGKGRQLCGRWKEPKGLKRPSRAD